MLDKTNTFTENEKYKRDTVLCKEGGLIMKKKILGFLIGTFCLSLMSIGCGQTDNTQLMIGEGSHVEEETPSVTIIDDNGGEVVNELLEKEEEDETIEAEELEDIQTEVPVGDEEGGTVDADQENKGEETNEEDLPVIDPVTEAEVEPDDIVVDVTQLNGHQENMLMLMDAMNMCLTESACAFDASNAKFFWNVLNYTIMTYPEVPGAESEELLAWAEDYSYMKVHKDLIKVYAEGLFASFSDLPAVPEDCMVTNSDTEGYYHLSVGDRGTSYGEIVTWVQTADGACHVEARLADADTGETIAAYIYELVENTNENAVFAYRIKNVKAKPVDASMEE